MCTYQEEYLYFWDEGYDMLYLLLQFCLEDAVNIFLRYFEHFRRASTNLADNVDDTDKQN